MGRFTLPKTIFVFLLLIVLCNSSKSQTTIIYDFKNKKFKSNNYKKIGEGSLFIINIQNINTLIYKIEIKANNVSIISESSPKFSGSLLDPTTVSSLQLKNKLSESADTNNKDINLFFSEDSNHKDSLTILKTNNFIELEKKFYHSQKRLNYIISIKDPLISLLQSDNIDFTTIEERKDLLLINQLGSTNKENLLIIIQELLNNIEETYNQLIEFNDLEDYKENFTKILKVKEEIDKKNYKNEAIDIIKIIDQINVSNFSYSSSIIFADKDQIEIEINIKPLDNVLYASPENRIIKFPLKVVDGFKIEVSAGLFATPLRDNNYILINENRDNIEGYVIKKQDQGEFEIGVNSLANFYWRFNSFLVPVINFGIGLSNPSETNFSYLLGAGFFLGDFKKLSFNIGIATRSIKVLSPKLNEDQFYTNEPIIEFTNKTIAKMYFGFSYNF